MLSKEKFAAQYVRMSTDMQKYSIENQSAAIALYAASRGLVVVQSYVDAGRSGLRMEKREALRTLIDDVASKRAKFSRVLVYDVSRWGRFQDIDESAYYEFICRRAGVSVEYCAEQFENDGSLLAAILKNLKRAMAGEFSRELSTKVFIGQCRLVEKGHRFGGSPGYGLRRMLVDENGTHKMILGPDQRKNLRSDYAILVPGPPEEVAVVHRIYDRFIEGRRSLRDIADELNADGLLTGVGSRWADQSVRELLKNEKYMGTNVFNRESGKLGQPKRQNPPAEWIRKVGAFEPIVSPKRFAQAQNRFKTLAFRYSKRDLLDYLTALWCRYGTLSRDIIDASPDGPCTHTFKNRFGSLVRAFQLVGFSTPRLARRERLRVIRQDVCKQIVTSIGNQGGHATIPKGYACQLRINDEIDAVVTLGHTARGNAQRKQNEWRFGYSCRKKPDIVVVARLNDGNSKIRDFYLLPFLLFPRGSELTVSGLNYQRLEPYRSQTLARLFDLCARERWEL